MTELKTELEKDVKNAVEAARGLAVTLTNQIEQQIYNGIMAVGGGGGGGGTGKDGATFIPAVSEAGVISWTNNGGLENPAPVNIMGPKGDGGEQGPQGPQGIQGPQGPQGEQAIAALNPRGDYDAAASPAYTLNDYISTDVGSYVCKADNPTNVAPTTGLTGDPYWQIMALHGVQGPQGPQGAIGPAGADGQAATVTVGTVTTLSAGQPATVVNSGTSGAAVFDFGIPKGADASPDGLKVYSTDEMVVGTWIDGRPIYRKVLSGTTLTNNARLTTEGNISRLISFGGGYIMQTAGIVLPAAIFPNTSYFYLYVETDANIAARVVGFSLTEYAIVCEYTKTTDVAPGA